MEDKIRAFLEGLEIQNINKFITEAKIGDYRNLGSLYSSRCKEKIEYWKTRCTLAEKCLVGDASLQSLKSFKDYSEFLRENKEK